MEVISVLLTLEYYSTQQFLFKSIGKVVLVKNPTMLAFFEPEGKLRLW